MIDYSQIEVGDIVMIQDRQGNRCQGEVSVAGAQGVVSAFGVGIPFAKVIKSGALRPIVGVKVTGHTSSLLSEAG